MGIAILPDESEDKLLERYTPLFEYLSSEIGAPYELIIPQSYSELLELFHEGKLDLAYFGGFTFLKAHFADGAVPLVTRDTDSSSTSYYLVNAGEQVKEISELIEESENVVSVRLHRGLKVLRATMESEEKNMEEKREQKAHKEKHT